MDLTRPEIIQIAGIAIAAVIGIVGLLMYSSCKKNTNKTKASIEQKSGAFSSGKQKANISVDNNNE